MISLSNLATGLPAYNRYQGNLIKSSYRNFKVHVRVDNNIPTNTFTYPLSLKKKLKEKTDFRNENEHL